MDTRLILCDKFAKFLLSGLNTSAGCYPCACSSLSPGQLVLRIDCVVR